MKSGRSSPFATPRIGYFNQPLRMQIDAVIVREQCLAPSLRDIFSAHSGAHRHCKRLPREVIQNTEHLVASAIAEFIGDESTSRQIALQPPARQQDLGFRWFRLS